MAVVVTALGNTASFPGAGKTGTVTPVANVPNGALIIVSSYISGSLAGNNTVTDSAGNAYTRVPSANLKLTADTSNGEIWWSANSNALTTTQSITYTSGLAVTKGVVAAVLVTGVTNEENYISDDPVTTANTLLTGAARAPLIVTSNTPNAWGDLFYGVSITILNAQNDVQNNDPLWTNLPAIATGTKAADINLIHAYKITNNISAQTYRSNTSGTSEHITSAVVSFRQKRTRIESTWIG